MPAWLVIGFLALGGVAGGVVNALLAQEGFVIPRWDNLPDGGRILRPGFVGNMLVGLVTSVVLAGLNSPVGQLDLAELASPYRFPLSAFAGAVLSGIGGARLLTNEVNRRYNQATTGVMADTVSNTVKQLTPDGEADGES